MFQTALSCLWTIERTLDWLLQQTSRCSMCHVLQVKGYKNVLAQSNQQVADANYLLDQQQVHTAYCD